MLKSIINILFPEYCLLCGKHGSSICTYCKRKLIPSLPECYKCRRLSNMYKTHYKCKDPYSLDSVFYGWRYNKNSSKLIKVFKYKGAYTLVEKVSALFCDRILETNFLKQFTNPILIPIPIHSQKEKDRGFNQSQLLGELVSKCLNIPFHVNILERKYYDTPQAEKTLEARMNLSRETFICKNISDKFKDILLIDDVITTGTTLDNACYTLKKVNPCINVSAMGILRGKPYYSSSVN